MRRILGIVAALALAVGLVVAWSAAGEDGGGYEVRAYFDNGGFVVEGEEVRIAGARVGTVKSVDVTTGDEVVSLEDGGLSIPGKAVVVLSIEDDGFKDFRTDADCIIRPQSLLGEKFVECTPTQPRAPDTPPPPELEVIEDGPGEGQRLLPLESTSKSIDLDLVQNINRLPYRERFRLILNDLGAGLAGRGEDLAEVVDRANPALRQTDRVLEILAEQNRVLAQLATDSDAVLEPLARERESVAGFIVNAGQTAEAAAERSADLEAGLERFPGLLRELRSTMARLRSLADEGTPLFADLGAAAPQLSRATINLPGFLTAAIPALRTLGDAAEESTPDLVASDPVIVQLRDLGQQTKPLSRNLNNVLATFEQTGGQRHLLDFIRNSALSQNGYDSLGHYLRTDLLVSNCVTYSIRPLSGCVANFTGQFATGSAAGAVAPDGDEPENEKAEPESASPADPLDLVPEITEPEEAPSPEEEPEPPAEGEGGNGDADGEEEPVPEPPVTEPEAAGAAALARLDRRLLRQSPRRRLVASAESGMGSASPGALGPAEAALLLEFLLGSEP